MTNIRDVARHAGVSISTVSNVINNRIGSMTEETRSKVESVMMELGYKPRKRNNFFYKEEHRVFGLMIPSIANPSFAGLAHALEIAANNINYNIIICSCYRDKEKEVRFINDMFNLKAHGIIVASSDMRQTHFINSAERGMVFLSYDNSNYMPGSRARKLFDNVSMDNFEAGRVAAEHLKNRGCKKIVFITESTLTVGRNQKISGFLSAFEILNRDEYQSRIIEVEALVEFGDSEMFNLGLSICKKILEGTNIPDGVVTINDALGIGLMSGIRAQGLKIPEDISVIGIDNITFSAFTDPSLASVGPPMEKMARRIIDRIIERIENKSLEPMDYIFKPEVFFRSSVKV